MADRRKFQSGKLHKGVVLTFLLVLGGAGLFTYQSLKPVFSSPAANPSAVSSTGRSSGGAGGGSGNVGGGQDGVVRNTDDFRQATLERDRQLLARMQRRKESKQADAELSVDHNYDAEAIKERVARDYEKVKKTQELSDGMKADFKKHYKNMTLD